MSSAGRARPKSINRFTPGAMTWDTSASAAESGAISAAAQPDEPAPAAQVEEGALFRDGVEPEAEGQPQAARARRERKGEEHEVREHPERRDQRLDALRDAEHAGVPH